MAHCILDLPDLALFKILSYASQQDLATLQLVSKDFQQVASDPLLWTNVHLFAENFTDEQSLQVVFEKYPKIRRIIVRCMAGDVMKNCCDLMAKHCPNLAVATFEWCEFGTLAGTEPFAQGCPNLEEVSCIWCYSIDKMISVLKENQALKKLHLSNIGDATLEPILSGCFRLKSISVTATDSMLDQLTGCLKKLSDCVEFVRVKYLCYPFREFSFVELRSVVSLTLSFIGIRDVIFNNGVLEVLTELPKLKTLSIESGTFELTSRRRKMPLLRRESSVSTVRIKDGEYDDLLLFFLVDFCLNLRELYLHPLLPNVTPGALVAVIETCSTLAKMSLKASIPEHVFYSDKVIQVLEILKGFPATFQELELVDFLFLRENVATINEKEKEFGLKLTMKGGCPNLFGK